MDDDDKVRAVTRDTEFSLSVIPYLQTASGKQLLDTKILDSLGEWQQAEALAMNAVGVPKSWHKFLPKADKDGRIWLAMQRDGDCWKVNCEDVVLSYHPIWGMDKGGDA